MFGDPISLKNAVTFVVVVYLIDIPKQHV